MAFSELQEKCLRLAIVRLTQASRLHAQAIRHLAIDHLKKVGDATDPSTPEIEAMLQNLADGEEELKNSLENLKQALGDGQ